MNEICFLPAVTGRCRASFVRYFFNESSEECEQFIYGGCAGNLNRFETIDECKLTCQSSLHDSGLFVTFIGLFVSKIFSGKTDKKRIKIANDDDKYRICRMPSQSGDCNESLKRWFYEFGECREFTYTGCNGNENNFKTQNECSSFCSGVKGTNSYFWNVALPKLLPDY